MVVTTFGVCLLGYHECIRCGDIYVSRSNCQNEAGLAINVRVDHFPDLVGNVCRLISHGYLGQTRQINEGDVKN